MARYQVKCSLSGSEAFKMGLAWAVLLLVTMGIAAIWFPFYFVANMLDTIVIEEV